MILEHAPAGLPVGHPLDGGKVGVGDRGPGHIIGGSEGNDGVFQALDDHPISPADPTWAGGAGGKVKGAGQAQQRQNQGAEGQ